jgi:prepilin-type N-terminal cleavage/methylation domain-containing protein
MRRRRGGFTIVELLTVMIVIGILAGMALLKYIDLRHRARTAEAIADLEAIRLAAYGAWYEHGTWPGEVGPGIVPPALVEYLPGNFSFAKPEYTLDWENLLPPAGAPPNGGTLSVVVTASDPRLQTALARMLGNKGPYVDVNGTLVFFIVDATGRT